jgi:hypothetical protein
MSTIEWTSSSAVVRIVPSGQGGNPGMTIERLSATVVKSSWPLMTVHVWTGWTIVTACTKPPVWTGADAAMTTLKSTAAAAVLVACCCY